MVAAEVCCKELPLLSGELAFSILINHTLGPIILVLFGVAEVGPNCCVEVIACVLFIQLTKCGNAAYALWFPKVISTGFVSSPVALFTSNRCKWFPSKK